MRLFTSIILVILFALGSANPVAAQGKLGKVGKIFKVEEANALFGKVTSKRIINTSFLKRVLKKADHYVRLKLNNKFLTIFEDTKDMDAFNSRFSVTAITADDSPEHLISVETVDELITLGGSETTTIEMRGDVLTVTNGAYTLEMTVGCPPWCL